MSQTAMKRTAASDTLQKMKKLPSESEVLDYASTLSNWGRWGAEDELGTVNLITPEKRKQAAGLVTDGVTVSCAWPISTDAAPDVSRTPIHLMTGTGEGFSLDSDPTEEQGSGDFIGLAYHGYTVTHVDAPSHIFMSGRMYNGLPSTVVNSTEGATAGSIELISDGIVTRCVLLDIARLRGVDWLAPGEAVFVEELERAETEANVRVGEGDVLLVRTGELRYRNEVGPRRVEVGKPGLHASCLPWLHERGVAMLGSDAIQDVQPSRYPRFRQPIHRIGIVHMGLWLIDNCNLEGVGAACAERNRWEFMLCIAPLRIKHGTGSPANPIAVF